MGGAARARGGCAGLRCQNPRTPRGRIRGGQSRGFGTATSAFFLDTPPPEPHNSPTMRAFSKTRTVICALSLFLAGNASPAPGNPPIDSATVLRGDAVVGVDSLGRVLVAVDASQSDDLVDYFALFTASDRLTGPWSRHLEQAAIVVHGRRLTLVSPRSSFAMSLALKGSDRPGENPQGPFEVFLNHDGIELVQFPGESSVRLADLTAADIHSGWPDAFYYDVLSPDTKCPPDDDCSAGSCPSTGCGIAGCPNIPTGCNVACSGYTYSCCKCLSGSQMYAVCRCRVCPPPGTCPQ